MIKGVDLLFAFLSVGGLAYKALDFFGFWFILQDVAHAIGFEDVNLVERKICGFKDKYRVEIIKQESGWFLIFSGGHLPNNLLLESEIQLDEKSDIQTGEWIFDKDVRVISESRAWALAVLGPEMRIDLLPWVKRGLRLQSGVISVRESLASDIPSLIENVIGLANKLSLPVGEIPRALLKNFKNEKQGGARLKILVALAREAPSSKFAQEAFDLGLKDEDDGVRLLSCVLQASLSRERLLSVWENPRTLDTLLRAMNLLLTELPVTPERSAEVLRGALLAPRHEIQLTAVRLLGRIRDKASLGPLLEIGAICLNHDLLNAIVESATQIGGPSVEPFLLKLLKNRETPTLIAVINALGRLGSWTSLEPLLQIANQDVGGIDSSPVALEAGKAIGLIRARLGPVEQGALSVSSLDEAEGGISLAGSGGELSEGDNASLLTK